MAMFNIYNELVTRKYHTHFWSFATIFYICVGVITYVGPLLIAYYSLGFWLKESTYREQPEVRFKHDLILVLQGTSTVLGYSTYNNFNTILRNRLRTSTIKSQEVDENSDGRYDYLEFTLEMPINANEDVRSVQLLLFFHYKLHKYSSVELESLAYLHYDSGISGSSFYTDGDLLLKQKNPLSHKGSFTKFNTGIVDRTNTDVNTLNLHSILTNYQARNLTTDFIGRYPSWISGKSSTFKIQTKIYYPEQTIIYRPGFWQLLKHAWIQYLAILFIFMFIFGHVKSFIYENRLVATIIKKKHHND